MKVLVVLPGLSPPLVTFKIKSVRWNLGQECLGTEGDCLLRGCPQIERTVQVPHCFSESQPFTRYCGKLSLEMLAFISEGLKMQFFLFTAKMVAFNDCCRKSGILWEDSP